jgi:hypothetical protein
MRPENIFSSINLPAMPHSVDAYDANLVGNFVNDAVVAMRMRQSFLLPSLRQPGGRGLLASA